MTIRTRLHESDGSNQDSDGPRASLGVVERAGFNREGVARKRELTASGERRDMVLYSLLPSDGRQAG